MILEQARAIVSRGTWCPGWIMIDKSAAERNAILRGSLNSLFLGNYSLTFLLSSVWPNAIIRLCQFHVIQAILRWDRDRHLPRDLQERAQPRLSIALKRRILYAFREMQRCRQDEDWILYRTQFERSVHRYLQDTPELLESVLGYFRENWFKLEWRGTCDVQSR